MTDVELRLRRLLVEQVDAELGPRRPPPRFDPQIAEVYPVPSGVQGLVSRPLLLSLVAAACVVAILLGSVGLSRLSSSGPTPPAVPTPTPTSTPSQTSSVTPTPSATASVQPNAPATGVAPAAGLTVTLAGARVTLPRGWVARPAADYDPKGDRSVFDGGLCLTPSTTPVVRVPSSCPVVFAQLVPQQHVNTNIDGGYDGDPAYCGSGAFPGEVRSNVQQDGVRSLGGRTADFRSWVVTCPDGQVIRIMQYEVATGPGFILYSALASAAVASAIEQMARTATLPSQTAPVRLFDYGYLRSVRPVPGGYDVRIDRAVLEVGGRIKNTAPATYSYFVPAAAVVGPRSDVATGRLVEVFSDGHRVTQFYALS